MADRSFLFRALRNKRKPFVSVTSVCVVDVSCAILICVNWFVCLDACVGAQQSLNRGGVQFV